MASYFDPGRSVWWYVVRMGLTSLLPSLALGALVIWILHGVSDTPHKYEAQFSEPESQADRLFLFFLFVVFSPVVETLLMSPILWTLSHIVLKPVPLAILSAIVWGVLHSLLAPVWGLIIAWPFYVFSREYLAWRPYGWWKTVGVVACMHAFHNLLPGLAIALLSFE
jgi:hypothetical protein